MGANTPIARVMKPPTRTMANAVTTIFQSLSRVSGLGGGSPPLAAAATFSAISSLSFWGRPCIASFNAGIRSALGSPLRRLYISWVCMSAIFRPFSGVSALEETARSLFVHETDGEAFFRAAGRPRHKGGVGVNPKENRQDSLVD